MSEAANRETRPIQKSLREYARGIAGGLLFSLPILFTEEVWIAGIISSPSRLLVYIAATFILLLGINRYAGLRRNRSFGEIALDAVEEMGIGLIIACVLLWLLDRIGVDEPVNEIIGQTTVAAMTVALGVSIGNTQLGNPEKSNGQQETEDTGKQDTNAASDEDDEKEDTGSDVAVGEENSLLGQFVIAMCGAAVFAASIAPTKEVARVAAAASLWKIVGLAIVSLLLGAMILSYSGFLQVKAAANGGGWSGFLSGAFVSYAAALTAAALSLWFYRRFENVALANALAQTIVLGVGTSLGAAAGKLLLKG